MTNVVKESPPKVPIYTTHMSYRVPMKNAGKLLDAYPISINIRKYIEPFVTYVYDRRIHRYVVDRAYVTSSSNYTWLHMPYYDLPRFISILKENDIPYRCIALSPQQGADVSFDMASWFSPKDERQAKAIHHLTTNDDPLRGLAIQTGGGKTATVIKTLSVLQKRALITMSRNIKQWVSEIKKFTNLTDDDIYVLQGGASIITLLETIDTSRFPKIIIGSNKTLKQWCDQQGGYEDIPPFTDICSLFDIGIRVIDEAHLNFYSNLIMDLQINPAITIPLTATFDVNDRKIKTIFDRYYPERIRFGENDYRRYVDIYAYSYITGYNDVPLRRLKTQEGYNHSRFEAWLLKNVSKLAHIYENVYRVIIDSHYINIRQPEDKMLIFCSTRQMCRCIANMIQDDYPDEKCGAYLGETDESVLDDLSIIVTTYLSGGVGTDIKNLRTVLLTISMKSRPANEQILGRLRELPDRTPEFVYIYHKGIPNQVDHATARHSIYRPLARKFTHTEIP